MTKGKRLLAISVVMAFLLTLGVVSVIHAATPPDQPQGASEATLPPLWQKVAEALGVTEQQFKDAVLKAQSDLFNERIDQLLADKRITEDQAEKMRQQHQDRLDKGFAGPGMMGPGFRGGAGPGPGPGPGPRGRGPMMRGWGGPGMMGGGMGGWWR